MNLSNSKKLILLFILLFDPLKISADNDAEEHDSAYNNELKKHGSSFWNALIPRYSKLQFAGSMGMFSLGGGWIYGKDHWETDLLLGFFSQNTINVHSDMGKRDLKTIPTFTLKQNYIPWRIPINNHIFFEPLSAGFYFNTLLSGKFWTKQPSKYPEGYYFFSTKIRTLIYAGERITFKLNRKNNRSLTFFYEINTCDLYLLCAAQNKVLKLKDYLSLSLGLKFQIF